MNIQRIIVANLLRVYPARWRAEYGAEFTHLLLSRPLSLLVAVDVVWSGLRQRARTADAATFAGLATMAMILAGLLSNTVLLQDSSITLPRVVVKTFRSDLYAFLLIAIGCWIQVWRGGTASSSGKAAARVSFLGGLPIMAAGLLALFGVLDPARLGYQGGARHPSPVSLDVFAAPLFALPQSFLFCGEPWAEHSDDGCLPGFVDRFYGVDDAEGYVSNRCDRFFGRCCDRAAGWSGRVRSRVRQTEQVRPTRRESPG